ncbi:MAG TPA: hypothetical protein ENH31_02735 [Nitrospirae bacterium]|nr:Pilus assembly protein, PilP [bacterium BMS3Abin10]HDK41401.1 hypothetical protein [Nitrospirota bacterium]HDK81468.1 hypothetical protein [Nitrospirota bacterium]
MKKLFLIMVVILFIFPVFTGCKKKAPVKPGTKAAAPKAVVKPEPKVILEVPAEEEKGKKYIYDPAGRRDPFVALVQAVPKKNRAKRGVALSPLENYAAADFRLIAVASKGQVYTALLLAPDNKSYTVKEGAVLGLNEGKVKEIDLTKLVIEEYIQDYKGELKPKKIVLELRKGEVEE